MSSNSSAGQVASASTAGNNAFGGAAWRAFNRSNTTGWVGTSPSTDWLKIALGSQKNVGNYKVTYGPLAPTGFSLYGSNDGTSWTLLDTQTAAGSYDIAPANYSYFRLLFTGSGSEINIAEWELFPPSTVSASLVSASLGIADPDVYCAFLIKNYTGVTFEIGGNATTVESVYDFDDHGRKVVIVSGSGLMQYTVNMTNAATEIHGAAMWAE